MTRSSDSGAARIVHEPVETAAFTGFLSLRCDDVDAERERVKSRARVCDPLEAFDDGMRELAVSDDNAYLLQLGRERGAARPRE
ncbi:MAG TPA: hypothetical protein VIA45_01070 [Thermoanaerobaculia bacterium]